MKYKRYPKYKDSGVEWIGEIPEGWEVSRVKYLVDVTKYYQIGDGDHGSIKPEMYLTEGIPYIRVQNLSWNGKIKTKDLVYISEEIHNSNLKSQLIEDDILIAKTGATIGKLGLVDKSVGISNTTSSVGKVTIDKSKHYNLFYLFFFQSFPFQEQVWLSGSQKSAQPGFNINNLVDFDVTVPTYTEEIQIAKFLKKQTTQFDELIAKSKAQIILLQEKRQALINHAVTKGLDPTVPMKDSGMEWIGEIPEKWDIYPVRYLLNPGKSGIRIGPFGSSLKLEMMKDDGFKIYGQENVIGDDFSLGRRFINEEKFEEMKRYEIIPDDIVITMMGTTGKSKVVPENIQQGIMDSHLVRMRVNQKICDSKLFSLVLNDSSYVQSQLTQLSNGSIMQGLNSQIIKSIKIILPSLSEQKQIYDFTQKGITYLDNLISKSQSQINFLQEKRQALITSAVTGKIDVRNGVAA